jgi:hypothetical protein
MRSFTLISLCAYMASANEDLANQVLDKLIDRLISMPIDNADLDKTTVAKPAQVASGRTAAMKGPGQYVQLFPAACGSQTCGMASVNAMQSTLQKYGVPKSPLGELALTSLASTRDPSMKAQVREVYSKLDPELKKNLQDVSKQVTVAADSLEVEKMAGITEPLGFWDPLEFSKDIPEGRLYYFREAELKNGRTAMLATLGIVFADKVHPFFNDLADGTTYTSAAQNHFTDSMLQKFWLPLLLISGAFELITFPDKSKAPGDLGFDPLGLKPKGEKEYLEMQNKELNNGRLAMMAFTGIIGAELLRGEPAALPR